MIYFCLGVKYDPHISWQFLWDEVSMQAVHSLYIYIFMFNALHSPQLSMSSLWVTGDCNALPFFFQNRELHVSVCTFQAYL